MWAQFSVRQLDGTQILKVENSSTIFGSSRGALQEALDALFRIVTDKGKDEINSILDELDRM